MADVKDMLVRVKGDTNNFEKSMKGMKSGTDATHTSFLKLTSAVAAGQLAFNAAEKIYGSVSGAISGVVKKTEELGLSTVKLMRETGMTAEQSSGLLAVFQRFGIDGAAASKNLGFFAKAIVATGKAAAGTVTPFSTLGLHVKDAAGHFKSTNSLLLEVSDKFKNMPAGVQKTALAMQLFGKSGKDMLPLLNQGSKGIEELEAHAKKLGVVLTQGNVDAIRKNMKAHREWQEAMTGVQLQIGTRLMPIIAGLTTKLSNFVASDKFQAWVHKMAPIIEKDFKQTLQYITTNVLPKLISAFNALVTIGSALLNFYEHHKTLVKAVTQVILALAVAFKIMEIAINAVKTATMIWNAVAALNPWTLLIAAVIAAILLLVTHWSTVKQWIGDFWKWLKNIFNDGIKFIKAHWDLIVGILLGPLGLAVAEIIKHWSTIKHGFSDVMNWVKSVFRDGWNFVTGLWKGLGNVFSTIWGNFKRGLGVIFSIITAPFKQAFNAISSLWNNTVGKLSFKLPGWVPGLGGKGFSMPQLPMLADGGIIDKATLALVGEGSSPEAVIPLDKLPALLGQMNSGGGAAGQSAATIHLEVKIGMYAGMPVEKRAIGLELWKEVARAARAQGVQLPMIGAMGVQ